MTIKCPKCGKIIHSQEQNITIYCKICGTLTKIINGKIQNEKINKNNKR
jgi:DNA-directed RNA polymerase subunit M/transcription elongation factor TFIIS